MFFFLLLPGWTGITFHPNQHLFLVCKERELRDLQQQIIFTAYSEKWIPSATTLIALTIGGRSMSWTPRNSVILGVAGLGTAILAGIGFSYLTASLEDKKKSEEKLEEKRARIGQSIVEGEMSDSHQLMRQLYVAATIFYEARTNNRRSETGCRCPAAL